MNEYSAPTEFIDIAAQQKLIRPQLDLAISRVLDHGQYIMGPEVKEFEGRLREYTGAKHALTCANGTDALALVLMAWDIGPGDAVFVPSFTYVATAEAPAQLRAIPFFVDVCEDTFNMDPQSFQQAIIDSRELGLKPAAVIAVDLFGHPADVDAIVEIAHAENIKVLVDGAQSFGGRNKGRKVGSMGDATTTSFFPAKPLGCYGDGGAVFTQNDEDAALIRSLSLHGKGSHKYENVNIGMNSRLDTIQAAILIEKLKIFPQELIAREEIARLYSDLLGGVLKVPLCKEGVNSAWALYTIRTPERDLVQANLKSAYVPSLVYYPIPLSQQLAYKHYPAVSSGLTTSNIMSESVLSIPMHPYLKPDEVHKIAAELLEMKA
jgi:dTDP-4-amino-4,6-dideoxygalactose transaminase